MPAPAHISHDSDSEHPTKVVSKSKSRKHSIHTHFAKDRNCEVCLRTKVTRSPCSRRTGTVVPKAENFADLITADHKVLNEAGESRNNHRYAVVVQDLATQSSNLIRAKQKLLRRRKRVHESFSSRYRSRQSVTMTIPQNLANPVKNYHGINEHPHLLDPRRKVLLKERYEE